MKNKTEIIEKKRRLVKKTKKSGFVLILGRPNVGKSTLMNRFLGEHISIVTRKPQTTRNIIRGILTKDDTQYIFVDSPGIFFKNDKTLSKYMNDSALSAINDADIVLLMLDRHKITTLDQKIIEVLNENPSIKLIVAINKLDRIENKNDLLPVISDISSKFTTPPLAIIPISAQNRTNLPELLDVIKGHLPESEFLYDEDTLYDRGEKFFISELIREQLIIRFGDELPHELAVLIDKMEFKNGAYYIYATIFVEKLGQKKIIVGSGGEKIKATGIESRRKIAEFLGKPVHLFTWVKVKENWTNRADMLKMLGIS